MSCGVTTLGEVRVRRRLYEPEHEQYRSTVREFVEREEYPVSRACIDARVQTIYGGTSEVMRTIIARDLTGLR